jgi:hypothetical protein
MVVTADMDVGSGGKKGEVADIEHLVGPVGDTEDWSGKFMFPSAGNPNGFTNGYDNLAIFWQFHDVGGMGINTAGDQPANYRHIYLRTVSPSRKVHSPAPVEFDRWYTWRIQVRWSTGADGWLRWWLDGQQLANWTGPVPTSQRNLQFGFYSVAQFRNEVWHSEIRLVQ